MRDFHRRGKSGPTMLDYFECTCYEPTPWTPYHTQVPPNSIGFDRGVSAFRMEGAGPQSLSAVELPGSDIKLTAYLKKLKTMKKKFFVLRSTSSSGPARLEYYDNEKKFRNGQLPKRSILLHTCFNINKKADIKHKFAIALYMRDDCFSIIGESPHQQEVWLDTLLRYQNQYRIGEQKPKAHYEYVWQGNIKPKAHSACLDIAGVFRLCLTDKSVCLVRLNSEVAEYTYQFSSIRRCGHSENFFFMEVGRSSVTGSGELWMQMDDAGTAQSMHEAVLSVMQANKSQCEVGSFRRRSNTSGSTVSNRNTVLGDEPFNRKRTASESHHQPGSPRHRDKRPVSSVIYQRTPSLTPEPPVPLASSPLSIPLEVFDEQRLRSDSMGSRSSHTSSHSAVDTSYDVPTTPENPYVSSSSHRSMTPETVHPITEEEPDYLPMTPTYRSTTPSPTRDRIERPGSSGSESQESGHHSHTVDGYIDMKPGSGGSTGNVNSSAGYIDMTPGQSPHTESSGYMMMGSSRTTAPIPIRPPDAPGYIDMGPSSQPLPTVKEGGSGEAYLPMTPTGQSPLSGAGLKPAKVVSYLSDDSMSGEFPKRAYSVGSRPVPKPTHRHHPTYENQRRQNVLDNCHSSSAPHLMVQQKTRNLYSEYRNQHPESSVSVSPLSASFKSDDSDSFMEMDFYRPRTASDSYGCRPRSSSFGKQYTQGHRPRSSSYGQQASRNKLSSLVAGSFESVRTTSQELKLRSQESLGKFSTSSRASSNDSMKRLAEELQQKTNFLNSDYMDMGFDKRKTPSPNIQTVMSPPKADGKQNGGYVDMTLGSSAPKSNRGVSPSSSSHSLGSSPSSTGHGRHEKHHPEAVVVKASGQMIHKTGFKNPVRDNHLHVSGTHFKTIENRSPSSSGRESEDESYVPFQPAGSSSNQSGPIHQHSLSLDSGTKSQERSKGHSHSKSPIGSFSKHEEMQKSKSDDESRKSKSGKHHSPKKEKQSKKHSPKAERVVGNQSESSLLTDKVVQGHSPTLDRKLDFSVDSDIFGNILKHESVGQSRSEKPGPGGAAVKGDRHTTPTVSSDESGYMDYLPGSEGDVPSASSKTVYSNSKQQEESSYTEFDPSDASLKPPELLDLNRAHSPLSKGQDMKEATEYMDFDPMTSPTRAFNRPDAMRVPSPAVSFISAGPKGSPDIKGPSAVSGSKGGSVEGARQKTETRAKSATVGGERPASCEVPYSGCDPRLVEENKDNEVKERKQKSGRERPAMPSAAPQSSKPSGKMSVKSSSVESQGECGKTTEGHCSSDKFRGCGPDEGQGPGRDDQSRSSVVIPGGQSAVEDQDVKIVIKNIQPLKPLEREELAAEDEGYVDIDFSKKDDSGADNWSQHQAGSSLGVKTKIVPLPMELCPETPKSYICDDSSDSSMGKDSVKSKAEVSPSGGRDSGSPWKQFPSSSPRVKGDMKSSPIGENCRKSVPARVGPGNGVSRQTSVPLGTAHSPRNSAEVAGRMRKASGPPAFPSCPPVKGGNDSVTTISGRANQPLDIGQIQELQKQNSMPCMVVPLAEPTRSPARVVTTQLQDTPHTRHSCTDLSAYEEMTFPPGRSSSQQQLTGEPQSTDCKLNYAQLELGGSSETMDEKSPRVRIRHPSSVEDLMEGTGAVAYAEIDYEKTESMKSVPQDNRDVKFTI